MELNPEAVQQVIRYLEKWKSPGCAICGHEDWSVAGAVFALAEYWSGTNAIYAGSQSVYPVIPVTCKTCGNVLFLSAVAAGVVPRPKG